MRLSRLESGRNPARKPDFWPETILRKIVYCNMGDGMVYVHAGCSQSEITVFRRLRRWLLPLEKKAAPSTTGKETGGGRMGAWGGCGGTGDGGGSRAGAGSAVLRSSGAWQPTAEREDNFVVYALAIHLEAIIQLHHWPASAERDPNLLKGRPVGISK